MTEPDRTPPDQPHAPLGTCHVCGAEAPHADICAECQAGGWSDDDLLDLEPAPAARLAALEAVATAFRAIGWVIVGAAADEAFRGHYGLSAGVLILALAVWYTGVLIGDRPRSA